MLDSLGRLSGRAKRERKIAYQKPLSIFIALVSLSSVLIYERLFRPRYIFISLSPPPPFSSFELLVVARVTKCKRCIITRALLQQGLLADVGCAELVTNAIRDYIGSGKPDEKDPGRLNGWHSSKRDPNVGEIPAAEI